jgi:hypothetical protein
MKLKLLSIFLVVAISGLSSGCTLSEVGQKTKSGFNKSGSYIAEKSKKGYRSAKKSLGFDGNSTADSDSATQTESNSSAETKATQ